jgi:iron complex transport system substrate-binding protein
VVSLLPSATEILFAIGAGPQVIGITHECDHPPEAQRLPRVTTSALPTEGAAPEVIDRHIRRAVHEGSSIYTLDEPSLRALAPDLVVTQELCDVCAVAYREVEQAVRRVGGDISVLSLEPENLDAICSTIVALGNVTGHRRAAELVAGSMSERIAVVAAMAPPDPRPVVVCIEWTDPLMAGGHWVPQMVELAGGRDALGRHGEPSREVTWDEVLAAEPDVMVLMPCGFGLEHTLEVSHEVTARPGFERLPCARSGRVVAVDGSSYFNRPGPRIVTGLEILAVALRASAQDALPKGAGWVRLPAVRTG